LWDRKLNIRKALSISKLGLSERCGIERILK